MTARYLLDTNIISDMVKHPSGVVSQRIAQIGETQICTSVIVASELTFGVEKKASQRLSRQLEIILKKLPILPLTPEVRWQYAKIRTFLEHAGTPIGPNDLFIAAHAVTLDLTLVTDNIQEFSRVPKLTVENWLRA